MGYNCKGICHLRKARTLPNALRYINNHRYCSFCLCYFEPESVRCPCCKAILRITPKRKNKNQRKNRWKENPGLET